MTHTTELPKTVSKAEWLAAHERQLAKEKAATRAHDALVAARRMLPRLKIEKDYVFDGPQGKCSLADLFDGRPQLVLYSFMFAPSVDGWPDAGCPGCSFLVDNIGNVSHLNARGTSIALVSMAPLANIERYRKRMRWTLPWYSSANNDFNRDIGVTHGEGADEEEDHRINIFLREGGDIFYTYFTSRRGTEAMCPTWGFLDMTPYGRQETWEVSPPGVPQTAPYEWWRRHDEYDMPRQAA